MARINKDEIVNIARETGVSEANVARVLCYYFDVPRGIVAKGG